jgi:hypothetical protein
MSGGKTVAQMLAEAAATVPFMGISGRWRWMVA